MVFKCDLCKYENCLKTNFERHLQSKKHKINSVGEKMAGNLNEPLNGEVSKNDLLKSIVMKLLDNADEKAETKAEAKVETNVPQPPMEEVRKKKVTMKQFLDSKCEDAWTIEALLYNAKDCITLDFLRYTYNSRDKDDDKYNQFSVYTYFNFLHYVMSEWKINKYNRPFHISDLSRQILHVHSRGIWYDLGEKQIYHFLNNTNNLFDTTWGIPRELNEMFFEKIEEFKDDLDYDEYRFLRRHFIMYNPYCKYKFEGCDDRYDFEDCPLKESFAHEGCYMTFFNHFYLPEIERY